MTSSENRIIVVDRHVLELELETDDAPRSLGLLVRVDGLKRWSSEEPGWRSLGQGVAGDLAFLWSARRLVVVPLGAPAETDAIDCDEDIVCVFRVDAGWLLVCETSLRLVLGGLETSRIDLPDVVTSVRWGGDQIRVQYGDGSGAAVIVAAEALELVDRGSR